MSLIINQDVNQVCSPHMLYKRMGAHLTPNGTRFCVLAPNAKQVEVVQTCYGHSLTNAALLQKNSDGTWEKEIEGVKAGTTYRYRITTEKGEILSKLDPYSFKIQDDLNCDFNSVVVKTDYVWNDEKWREERKKYAHPDTPVSIYEIHLSHWKKNCTYKELAPQLAQYCKTMGYTHVELFSLLDHDIYRCDDGNRQKLPAFTGFQPISYFAPNHRLFSKQGWSDLTEFQQFIEALHHEGIGVIIDWIPNHFWTNSSGLAEFDGTTLYEYPDKRQAWACFMLNCLSARVQEFLLSSAYFWMCEMGLDGIRVDAIDATLWNCDNQQEEIKRFFHRMNSLIKKEFPGALLMAEGWGTDGSLTDPHRFGFTQKWTGESNQILEFFRRSFDQRCGHSSMHTITHAPFAGQKEKGIWQTTHDQSGKRPNSLYHQMPGDHFQKLANMRLMISYLMTLPGIKMMFMGDDLAQKRDWESRVLEGKSGVEWNILNDVAHKGMQEVVKALNNLYKTRLELHRESIGLEWIDVKDTTNNVISFHRGHLACVFNFSHKSIPSYDIHFPNGAKPIREMVELFNSDAEEFGGSGNVTPQPYILKNYSSVTGFRIRMPALACIIFEEKF